MEGGGHGWGHGGHGGHGGCGHGGHGGHGGFGGGHGGHGGWDYGKWKTSIYPIFHLIEKCWTKMC